MPAHYDTYDYPSYWEGRDYEHKSEVMALKYLLGKIQKIDKIMEVGAGYGRLTPTYLYRGKRIILTDPSFKLLGIAKETFIDSKKITFLQSRVGNLPQKIRSKTVDLVIMVRVMHHLENPQEVFEIVNKILKPGGYFILEFANKSHAKAVFKEICRGNFTFPMNIFSADIRSKKSIRKRTLPFVNYHPDIVSRMLKETGFNIVEKRSVSNIRSEGLKKAFNLKSLLTLEGYLQKPLSYINFGPSIFVLARKKG